MVNVAIHRNGFSAIVGAEQSYSTFILKFKPQAHPMLSLGLRPTDHEDPKKDLRTFFILFSVAPPWCVNCKSRFQIAFDHLSHSALRFPDERSLYQEDSY
jgi:hypothetical protein